MPLEVKAQLALALALRVEEKHLPCSAAHPAWVPSASQAHASTE